MEVIELEDSPEAVPRESKPIEIEDVGDDSDLEEVKEVIDVDSDRAARRKPPAKRRRAEHVNSTRAEPVSVGDELLARSLQAEEDERQSLAAMRHVEEE